MKPVLYNLSFVALTEYWLTAIYGTTLKYNILRYKIDFGFRMQFFMVLSFENLKMKQAMIALQGMAE